MNPQRHPKILVVEDEGIVAWDIQRNLSDLGFVVTGVASSAEEAAELTSADRPDLVLMDIHIQGPQDGIAAADLLRHRFGVAVIFLTAHGDAETIERARQTEPLAYLLKPFKKTELYSAVQIALSRHELEQKLRARERLLATTLRSIGDAVITTDAEGKVTSVNTAAESLTGWTQEEAQGRSLSELLTLRDERTGTPYALRLDRALRARTALPPRDAALVRKDGAVRPVSDSLAPVVDGEAVLGSVLVCRDMSEQRRNQQKLELADRMASLGTLAAGIAHEINNPLSFVTANVTYAMEELRGGVTGPLQLSDVVAALEEASDGAQRVKQIVAELRQFSRPPASGDAEADVHRAVEWACEVTAPQWKHRARLLKDLQVVPPVRLDPTRLGQVLVNLLVNAAHAIEPGSADGNQIRIRCFLEPGGQVVVEVEDTGKGMTEEVRSKLFTPFFSTKAPGEGTGLGLSVSLSIVRGAGGEIEVESAAGRGATFRLLLPPAPEDASTARPGEPSPRTPSPRRRVLAIDDEPQVLRAIERVLRADYQVTCASSAEVALQALETGDFDVILCDLVMPKMTGMDFYLALASTRPALLDRVIFLSGGAFTPVMADFLKGIPNLKMDKPFDLNHLRRVVAEAVARAASLG